MTQTQGEIHTMIPAFLTSSLAKNTIVRSFNWNLGKMAARSAAAVIPAMFFGSPKSRPRRRKGTLNVHKRASAAKLPSRAYSGDAGLDLYASESMTIPPGERGKISTGISMEIPKGYFGDVRGRSGWSSKGLLVKPGTIDSNYRGEILVMVENLTDAPIVIHEGDKIAQIVIIPYAELTPRWSELKVNTERGEQGFGSSGF